MLDENQILILTILNQNLTQNYLEESIFRMMLKRDKAVTYISCVKAVDSLEEKGLITSEQLREDRDYLVYAITEAGQAALLEPSEKEAAFA